MKKALSLLLVLLLLVSNITTISAFNITDDSQVSSLFPTDSVSVEGNKITLLKHIQAVAEGIENNGEYLDYNEPIVFESGTHIVELNGYLLSPSIMDDGYAFIVKSGANVTIQNTNFSACGIYGGIKVEEGGSLTIKAAQDCNISVGSSSENGCEIINEGTLVLDRVNSGWAALTSYGNLTINNCYFSWGLLISDGKAYINGGHFNGIAQEGGELYITDCNTASGVGGLFVATSFTKKTELSGGVYDCVVDELDETIYPGLVFDVEVKSGETVSEDYIKGFIPEGYKAIYQGFKTTQIGKDEEYDYYSVSYDMVAIVPLPEKYSDVMKKITTSETWTVYAEAPKSVEDSDFLLSAIAKNRVKDNNYDVYAFCADQPFNPNIATIYIYDVKTNAEERYTVNIEYVKPDGETKTAVDEMVKKMKNFSTDEWKFYPLNDLYLVNYLATLDEGEETDDSVAINFSKQFIDEVGAGKFTFAIDARLGGGDLFEIVAGGHTVVMYDGKVYATTEGGIVYQYVMFIPNDTADNSEAYMSAVMKRITDYLGKDCGISMNVSGSLNEFGDDLKAVEKSLGITIAGDNYYTLKIGEREYDFVVSKSEDKSQFEAPKYIGSDLMGKIKIDTTDKSVPFDTKISVNEVKNDTIKNALGTDLYQAFDITLYSDSLGSKITKLDEGTFTVGFSIPSEFSAKDLTVFYIDDNGKIEEHEVTVVNNFATFETDHFSTYALTVAKQTSNDTNIDSEKQETTTPPKTGDNSNIFLWTLLFFISGGALTALTVLGRKSRTVRK